MRRTNTNFRRKREPEPEAGTRPCDWANCGLFGHYPAPKSRTQLRDYYFFCIDHVREYNRSWNYFGDLTPEEIEEQIRRDTVWDRPTWKPDEIRMAEERIRESIFDDFGIGHRAWRRERERENDKPIDPEARAEREALAVLELRPPVAFDDIKRQYKVLAKKYHPDLTGGDKRAEDRLKEINQAFGALEKLYDRVMGRRFDRD